MKYIGEIKTRAKNGIVADIQFSNSTIYGDSIPCHLSKYNEDSFDEGIRVEFEVEESNLKNNKFTASNVTRVEKNKINVVSSKVAVGYFEESRKSLTYSLDEENSLDENLLQKLETLKQKIENGEICMIVWKSQNLSGITKGTVAEKNKKLLDTFEKLFPNFKCMNFVDKKLELQKQSHPLISKMWNLITIVSKEIPNKEVIVDCREEILKLSYQKLLKKSRKRWTIIGDETGTFEEFRGKTSKKSIQSKQYWLVIPPKIDLPPLSPFFHGTGDKNRLIEPLIWLFRNPSIKLFEFKFQEGKAIENVGKIAGDVHYSMWLETIPIVLESVSNKLSKEEEKIEIYAEQVGSLQAGKNLFEEKILDLKTSLNTRKGWSSMDFVEKRILAKNPCEHPWMGYPDALAHVFDDNKMDIIGLQKEIIEDLRSRIISTPFRQRSLNQIINPSIKDSSRSLYFLKSISGISKDDVRDYVKPFLMGAILEARDSLKDSEWQELLQHFKNTAETIEGQHSANLILSGIDIDSILPKFRDEMEQYIFLKSVLGSSNHIGTTKVANKCKAYIDDLLDSGLSLSKRETRKLKTLQAGANDNQFDWAHIIDDFDEEQDAIDWDEETQHFLGSQALSRALRNHENDLEIAWAIEEQLTSIRQNDFQYRRRYIYRSELLMQKHDFEEGKRCLEVDFPEKIRIPDNESHLDDRYYLASLLKACALTSSTENFQEYSKYVIKSLDEKHPSQRIAYWYCRWANEIARTESEAEGQIFEACLSHLISLKSQQFFTKEAPGVILACELIDLNKRGLIEEEHESFLQNVLDNSEVFANEWVSNNPPNEDDWLAPLNFNYR